MQIFLAIIAGKVLPNYADICASVQHAVFRHLAKKLERAFEYIKVKSWASTNGGYPQTLVWIIYRLSLLTFVTCLFSARWCPEAWPATATSETACSTCRRISTVGQYFHRRSIVRTMALWLHGTECEIICIQPANQNINFLFVCKIV